MAADRRAKYERNRTNTVCAWEVWVCVCVVLVW
jgi:hypothetical protein